MFTKGITKNYNVIISRKNISDQPIDSDIKRYKEIRKLTTGQGEDYTTGCLLDYDYIKNYYRLIAVDLSGQEQLDADPKTIQQREFVGQLKKLDDNVNVTDDGNDQSMFVLTILEKNKRITIKTLSRKCNSIIKDGRLSRSESQVNKCTIKQIKTCSKK